MSEWKSFCLGDVCIINAESYSKNDNWTFVNYLDTGNITANKIEDVQYINILEEKFPSRARRKVKTDSIIYSTVRPNQRHYGIIKSQPKNFLVSTGFAVIDVNPEIVDANFLYYRLTQDEVVQYLQSVAEQSTTAYPSIRPADVENLKFSFPSMDIQKKIAAVLSALDDKIELNNAINKNLEEQAQAIFDNFFIEDNRFVEMDSELLSDLCEVITKGTTPTTLGKKFVAKGINFIKAESIQDNHSIDFGKISYIDEETQKNLKRSIIKDEDILFTIAGTLGRFTFVDKNVLPANTNQAVAIIRTDKKKINPRYVYSFFLCNWHMNHYKKLVQQSVQANLSLTTIKSLSIPILSNEQMKNYNKLIEPIIFMVKSNQHENKKLGEIRDALLPRLMSGEIDVSAVEI